MGAGRRFPGQIVTERREATIITATPHGQGDSNRTDGHRQGNTFSTDGSCLDDKRVGAAFIWQSSGGRIGRRYHLCTNKEDIDAEVFAVNHASHFFDCR